MLGTHEMGGSHHAALCKKSVDARKVTVTCSPDPDEIKMAEALLTSCSARPNALLGNPSLGQLAALIQSASICSWV